MKTVSHEDDDGPRVLFIVNPSAEGGDADVRLPAPQSFVDALTGERFEGQGSLVVPMRAQSCRMLSISREPPERAARRASTRPSARAPRGGKR
jgi:hypothetical protein